MTNWNTLPYELKCIILGYHVERALSVKIDIIIEDLKRRTIHAIAHSSGPPPDDMLHLLLYRYDLCIFLTVAPKLRQDAVKIIAKRLPVLCDKGIEHYSHEMSLLGVHIGDDIVRSRSKTLLKLQLEGVKAEIGHWHRDTSGRLRSIDYEGFHHITWASEPGNELL